MKTPLFNTGLNKKLRHSTQKGLTLVELIVVICIFGIILALSMSSFYSSRKSASLNGVRDSIVSTLEQARTNSLSGKGGTNYSVVFASTTYTLFTGSTYNSSDTTNRTRAVSSGLSISTSYTTNNTVTFSRLYGLPQTSGTITVTDNTNASSTRVIQIGSQGEITVVK